MRFFGEFRVTCSEEPWVVRPTSGVLVGCFWQLLREFLLGLAKVPFIASTASTVVFVGVGLVGCPALEKLEINLIIMGSTFSRILCPRSLLRPGQSSRRVEMLLTNEQLGIAALSLSVADPR